MKYSNLLQNYDIEYLEEKFITRNKKIIYFVISS